MPRKVVLFDVPGRMGEKNPDWVKTVANTISGNPDWAVQIVSKEKGGVGHRSK